MWRKLSHNENGLCAKSLQLCSTHCDPVDCSLPVSSVHRILQARLSEWVAMSSRGSSQIQGSNSCLLGLLHWPVGCLPLAPPPRKPENSLISPQNINCIFSIWPSSSTLDTSLENWNKNISIGEGNGNPLQYSCPENPMDRGAWWATVMRLRRVRHDWTKHTHTYDWATHTHTHMIEQHTHTHTHCSQRFQLSLRTSHPVQNRPRHPSPPSRGSLSSLDPGANHFTSSTSAPDQVQWTWCSVFLIASSNLWKQTLVAKR